MWSFERALSVDWLTFKWVVACVPDHCHTGWNFQISFRLHVLSILNDEESGTG